MANTFPYISWSGPGIQPWSGLGLQQTLRSIGQAAVLRRTINGELRDLSRDQYKLYETTISGAAVMAPAFDGLFEGAQLVIDCAIQFSFKTAGGAASRPIVAGSDYVYGDYTFYRPQLTVRITSGPERTYDEYGGSNGWTFTAQEVGGETVSA